MQNWYAIHTRYKCERKVTSLLSKKKIENFLPVNRIIKGNNNDSKKVVDELLFNSFVFVKIREEDIQIIKQMNDVINFVHWLGSPAIFNDFEIASINTFLNHHYNLKL